MNSAFFTESVERRLELVKEVLVKKGQEYATDDNRMHNFDVSASRRGVVRERVMDFYQLKHEVSIGDMINDIEKGKLPTLGAVEEKFGDLINYYIIMEASIKERIAKEEFKNELIKGL